MGKRITRRGRRLCYRVVNGRKRLRRCGCGGAPGCCICVDTAAAPGAPCYLHYGAIFPCNSAKACCCGSRIRVTQTNVGSSQAFNFDFYNDKSEYHRYTTTLKMTLVFDYETYTDPVYGCQARCSCVAASYEFHYLADDETGKILDKRDTVYPDCKTAGVFSPCGKSDAFRQAQVFCRPEPGTLARMLAFPAGEFRFYHPKGKLSEDLLTLVDAGCDVRNEVHGYQGRLEAFTEFHGSAACKTADMHIHSERLYTGGEGGDRFGYGEGVWDERMSVRVETLEDDCCPPPGDGPFEPHGPANPTDPSFPGGIQGCPRGCGTLRADGRCGVCGYCGGCGG